MELVQCVPNVSEGRREAIIDAIVATLDDHDVEVLDVSPDPDHNRTDVTFVGTPAAVEDAAFDLALAAVDRIDMTGHEGEHPRMGAVDVVPFVPVRGVSMDDCIALARSFAERFAAATDVPTYLYEAAATRPDRENLAAIRRGEFEGLREAIGTDPAREPDFGPERIHPSAGATAVGARFFLVAFNVNLDTDDVEVADAIARAVRHSSGGYRHVKAMGFEIRERGLVQVSMNMTDYRHTPLFRVFETIRSEAARHGVDVVGSEIVGPVPLAPLVDAAEHYLRLEDFDDEQVLEARLLEGMA
ncbi:MAG: glutamate formimidoyltransferase [Halobacteriales archaeon]